MTNVLGYKIGNQLNETAKITIPFKTNMKITILSKDNYKEANFIELVRDKMAGIFHARHV